MSEPLDPNQVSQKLYGDDYDRLSAWGKMNVDHVIQKIANIKVDAPWNQGIQNQSGSLHVQLEAQARIIEDLQVENAELWQENEELKTTLAKASGESLS